MTEPSSTPRDEARIDRAEVMELWKRRDTLSDLEVRCLNELGWKHVGMKGLQEELAEARQSLSDGMPKWRDADSDPPADAQQVLAGWFGPSCVEGMETLIYHAADAPDSREAWQDVHGEDRDPPTHWTIVEAPK